MAIRIPGDQRAWDAVIVGEGWKVAIEAETRPRDIQRLLRRVALKQRDDGPDCVILLLAGTRHNAALVAAYRADLASMFPADGRRTLELLGAGARPEGSAVILL